MALDAIGQVATDQAPHFQESSHSVVLPCLLRKMDDSVDKVKEVSMSSFVAFTQELDDSLMAQYTTSFMNKLVERLQHSSHRGVTEEAITSIAVIAGIIEKDFAIYY